MSSARGSAIGHVPSDEVRAATTVHRLLRKRHIQFLTELILLSVLSAGLWFVAAPGLSDVDKMPSSYRIELYIHSWERFAALLGVGWTFLLIVYYGTSYEMTPLRWIGKRAPSSLGLQKLRADYGDDRERNPVTVRVAAEDIQDRVADTAVEPLVRSDAVDTILHGSAHSAAKLAAKMERRINTHLILGVLVGLVGLSVWYYSFFGVGLKIDKDNWLQQTLPRITILFFIELLAGFFLRQYRIGVEDLKYFLELQRRADAKRIAYSIFDQLEDKESKRVFATALMQERSDTRLSAGETTTSMIALEKEQNEILKAFAIAGEKLSDAAKLLKGETSKKSE
jgi:hypothetical protein